MAKDLIKGKMYRIVSTANYNSFRVGDIVVAIETGWAVRCVLEKDWESGITNGYYSNWISYNDVVQVEYALTTLDMLNLARKTGKTYVNVDLRYNVADGFVNTRTGKSSQLFVVIDEFMNAIWNEEDEIKELTIEEIEEKLGYKIKIVEER